ncbi:hypothetical protein F5Y08DRAFT_100914 [Xylaria arbuscula]|nr:hypothetical protein F5Y08DRAFT_100914 [Xylaria arbuscula]
MGSREAAINLLISSPFVLCPAAPLLAAHSIPRFLRLIPNQKRLRIGIDIISAAQSDTKESGSKSSTSTDNHIHNLYDAPRPPRPSKQSRLVLHIYLHTYLPTHTHHTQQRQTSFFRPPTSLVCDSSTEWPIAFSNQVYSTITQRVTTIFGNVGLCHVCLG